MTWDVWSTVTVELGSLKNPVDTSSERKGGAEEQKAGRKMEVGDQAQTVLTLGLDQITKFIYRLDGPLGEGNV